MPGYGIMIIILYGTVLILTELPTPSGGGSPGKNFLAVELRSKIFGWLGALPLFGEGEHVTGARARLLYYIWVVWYYIIMVTVLL